MLLLWRRWLHLFRHHRQMWMWRLLSCCLLHTLSKFLSTWGVIRQVIRHSRIILLLVIAISFRALFVCHEESIHAVWLVMLILRCHLLRLLLSHHVLLFRWSMWPGPQVWRWTNEVLLLNLMLLLMHCLECTCGMLCLELLILCGRSLGWIIDSSFHELLFGLFMRLDTTTLIWNLVLVS